MKDAFAFRVKNLELALKSVGGGVVEIHAKTDSHGVFSSNARVKGEEGSWIASLYGLLDPIAIKFDCTKLLQLCAYESREMGVAEIWGGNKIHFIIGKREITLDYERVLDVK